MAVSKLSPQHVDKYLDQVGITDLDLRVELKDHIFSILEYRMDEGNGEECLAYMGYEVKNLVGEIKQEVNTKSKERLINILIENVSSYSIFIVIFIACICYSLIGAIKLGDNGFSLISSYICITPLAILIYIKSVQSKITANDYYTKCLIKNSLIPFMISAGIGMVTIVASVIIYDKFFGGFHYQVIGTIVSSIAFGLYVKTMFDTFFKIPRMIRDEVNDLDEMKTLIGSAKLLFQPRFS